MAETQYVERALDSVISTTLEELPGVMIVGPRAVGKTTSARRLARSVVQLDRESSAFEADPDSALRGLEEPILIDEWQVVPGVLGAIKRSIDRDSRPGRFIVTGSVQARMTTPTWPATGRLVTLNLLGMTVREQLGRLGSASLLDSLLDGAPTDVKLMGETPDLRDYVEIALRSGYPEPAVRLSEGARKRWLRGYIDHLITHDVEMLERHRDPAKMHQFLQAFAAVTAQVTSEKTIYAAAGINHQTMAAYEQLLANLFVVDRLPAWWTNRLKRLNRAPKRYLVDTALAVVLLGVNVESIMREGTLLGPIIETFVVSQLRAELASSRPHLRLHHLRVDGGRHEVDAVIELENGDVVAFEIKSASAVSIEDAKHLVWMRDELGKRFRAGVVLHTGPRSYELDSRIAAIPIAALWA